MRHSFIVQVLFMRQGKYWVAQGLEYDLAAQGRTKKETKRAFERTFTGRLILDRRRGRQPLEGLHPAPQKFWDIFAVITRSKKVLERPERMHTPSEVDTDAAFPPAFMIPVIQQGTHQHS